MKQRLNKKEDYQAALVSNLSRIEKQMFLRRELQAPDCAAHAKGDRWLP